MTLFMESAFISVNYLKPDHYSVNIMVKYALIYGQVIVIVKNCRMTDECFADFYSAHRVAEKNVCPVKEKITKLRK